MMNEKLTMKSGKNEITDRTISYSIRIMRIFRELLKDDVWRVLGNQLLRSGTSIGANVHEAQGAQSKADFIAKMSIAHKEARETAYWFRLLQEDKLITSDRLDSILDETEQIIKILSSILISSKNKD